ncbi:MAG: cytochrome c3 family protein [Planctomycetota bacterium]|nr:cytochrome c3 family protein [Planctomycetota bacterium]
MNETPAIPTTPPTGRPRNRAAIVIVACLAVLLPLTAWGFYLYYPSGIGPAQPISFSHRVHAGDKRISCLFCHEGALDTPRAGVPPLQTCMLCHERVIITHPEIVKLRTHWENQQPVEWVRVNDVPDFVFFNHSLHVRKGVDCGRCHGDVAAMDRVDMPWALNMGFCVQCHRDNNVSHDCLICHR